jgi:hypothetical protein
MYNHFFTALHFFAAGVVALALTIWGGAAFAQEAPAAPMPPVPSTTGTAPPAPTGHRQPTLRDLPPDASRTQTPADLPPPAQGSRAGAGKPPTLEVGPSCDAAARGSVVLGRDKKACLADENAALDTLKQNWSKYSAADKTQCVGMTKTGCPASYVELLSCVEIMRDARNIQNGDVLESEDRPVSTRRGR